MKELLIVRAIFSKIAVYTFLQEHTDLNWWISLVQKEVMANHAVLPWTSWELMQHKIDVTLICDNMAAQLMKEAKIDKILVGADRIAANGDAANKIGTYNLAVLANFHRIPFYVEILYTENRNLKWSCIVPHV